MPARRIFAFLVLSLTLVGSAASPGCSGGSNAVDLQGVGATFPNPLYQKWFGDFHSAHPEVRINYDPQGSGAGVKQFTDNPEIDFGASDAPLSDEEIAKVRSKGRDLFMLPMTAGPVVVTYNVPNVPRDLKLSRKALLGIFLGKITNWNDPAIRESNKDNPNLNLPDLKISVVRRSDGSGTTYAFTRHLSAIDPDGWGKGPGFGKAVNWPVGTGSKGNDGVTAQVKQNEGSIGYVELSYAARDEKLGMITLENHAGQYIKPSLKSAQVAIDGVKLPEDMRVSVPDPEAKDAYPIVSFTWILVNKNYPPAKGKALKDVLKYCLTDGQKQCEGMDYLRLPADVARQVLQAVEAIQP